MNKGRCFSAPFSLIYTVGTTFKSNTLIETFNEFKLFTKVYTINDNAFDGCRNLNEILLPENVGEFKPNVFSNTKLKTLTIPINTVKISVNAFSCMPYCETIISLPKSAPPLPSNPWSRGSYNNDIGYYTKDAGTNIIYIPKGATGYDASNWQVLTNSRYGFTFVEMEE